MQLRLLLSGALAALLSVNSLVSASPLPCPRVKVDAILKGELGAEACCSYGICKKDVVIKSV